MPNFYEYHDHTADVRIHAVGDTIESAFEQAVLGTMNIMTDTSKISEKVSKKICCSAPDIEILLVDYLTEYLAIFDIEDLVFSRIDIKKIDFEHEDSSFTITSTAYGEKLNPSKHEIETEVKAITFSYLEIIQEKDKSEIWVVFDL